MWDPERRVVTLKRTMWGARIFILRAGIRHSALPNGAPKNLARALFGAPRRFVLAFGFDVLENAQELFRGDLTDRTGAEF